MLLRSGGAIGLACRRKHCGGRTLATSYNEAMCGRFVSPSTRDLERYFGTRRGHNPLAQIEITYNAAPSMSVSIVRSVDGALVFEPMQWGFIPAWWSKDEIPKSTINARLEEAATKPMWRDGMKRSRALVPALGYYEWKVTSGLKQPYFIHAPDRSLMCFAGLWSQWREVRTFAILTTAAAPGVSELHHRMPVVVPQVLWVAWTDPEQNDGAAAAKLAQESAVGVFSWTPVSTYVNSPKNQGESCVSPLVQA